MTYRTLAMCSTIALGTVLVTFHDFRHLLAICVGLGVGFLASRLSR